MSKNKIAARIDSLSVEVKTKVGTCFFEFLPTSMKITSKGP